MSACCRVAPASGSDKPPAAGCWSGAGAVASASSAIDWIRYAADIYLQVMEEDIRADVSLVWFCEPDESFHHLGIGSPGALETIRHVDHQFGRILDHHADAIRSGDLQIIAMSDHGQITLRGEALDITGELKSAGFRAGTCFDGDTDLIFAGSNAGGIWVKDNDPALTEGVTAWLLDQDWCGPIFTRHGTLGTLRLADVFQDHARAPEIALVMRNDHTVNAHGLAGETVHASAYPVGGGSHGGLNAHELHNVLTLGGTAFRSGITIDAHAGNVDITPTILALLGIERPAHLDGRALTEAFSGGPDPTALASKTVTISSTNSAGPRTHVSFVLGDVTRALADRPDDHFDVATMVLVLHEMPVEALAPVLREVARLARQVLCVDFRAPMPWNRAGVRNRLLEIAAGLDHYRAYRAFQRVGGVPGAAREAGLVYELVRPVDAKTMEMGIVRRPV